jgi:hypothetical protein
MKATIRLSRVDTRRLQQLIGSLPGAVDDALNAAAHEALAQIQLSFNTSPAGETYTHGSIEHVASAPGYPPNVDTGTLRASMRAEKAGPLEYQVMDGVEYGVYLELGTERVAARPFVTPVIEDMRAGELGRFMKRYLQETGTW